MKSFEYSKFDRLLAGLTILNDYKPFEANFLPINNSYPNGQAMFASRAFLLVGIENWPVNKPDSAKLRELGWVEDDGAGDSWTFK